MEEQNIPTNNPVLPPEETPPKEKTERRLRTAHCRKCSNEWVAKNGNDEKPSRCPECKSRNVVWKDMMNYIDDMEKTVLPVEKPESTGNSNNCQMENLEEPVITGTFDQEKPVSTTLAIVEKPESTSNSIVEKPVITGYSIVEKVEKPPLEKPENLEEIEEEWKKTGFNINPMLIIFGFGAAVAIGIFFFRNSRKNKAPVEKAAPPKKIQTRQIPPRRPIPGVLKQQGVAAVQGNAITNRSALTGGIV